jgi:putative SOS response-associated peptidase YedK
LPDDELFAFAGLWENNKEFGESATIIPTSCNEATAAYHDRMPVILDKADWAVRLNPANSKEQLLSLIRPAPVDLLHTRPVSTMVNSPKNRSPECAAPLQM